MRRLALVGAIAGVLMLSACSSASGDDNADNEPAAAADGSGTTDFAAYSQCLSEHGVDLPQGDGAGFPGGQRPSGAPTAPPSGFPTARPSGAPSDFPSGAPGQDRAGRGMRIPDGVDEETWQSAQQACESLRPARPDGFPGANGRPGGGGSAEPSAGANQYAVFWRCMADHDVTPPASGLPDDLDTSNATVKQALDTCDALLPAS